MAKFKLLLDVNTNVTKEEFLDLLLKHLLDFEYIGDIEIKELPNSPTLDTLIANFQTS